MFPPSLPPFEFLVFQLTLNVCYSCMHLLFLCLWSFYICSIKVIFRFVCLWLRHQSAALSLMAGSVWHLWKYSNFSTGRHQSSGLLFYIIWPLLGDVAEDRQQSLAAALVSGLIKKQKPHFRRSGLVVKRHENFIGDFFSSSLKEEIQHSWMSKFYCVSS